jgi:hypothetical protein
MAASPIPQSFRLGALLALLCLHATPLLAAAWRNPVEIVYDATNSPLAAAEVEAALQYVTAAWAARIDLPLRRSDAKPGAGYQANRIVIRWIDSLQQIRNGTDLLSVASTRRWVWPATQAIAGAEIFLHITPIQLRRGGPCFTHALLHEFGHALGLSHLADTNAVMREGLGSCHHTLTAADIAAAPYAQHPCHAEVLPDFSIYMPVLNAGARSYAGRLRYTAGTWKTEEYREVPHQPECRAARLEDGNLILEGLWSPARTWQVELSPADTGAWKLLFAL